MGATRIVEKVSLAQFQLWLRALPVRVDSHADFRLSESQRKIFTDEALKDILTAETPVLVGLQKNGRYAAFFKRKVGFVRIIFHVSRSIEIVTFYNTDILPEVRV